MTIHELMVNNDWKSYVHFLTDSSRTARVKLFWSSSAADKPFERFEGVARAVRMDDNFFEQIAWAVRTDTQSVRTADERKTNGYPFDNGKP